MFNPWSQLSLRNKFFVMSLGLATLTLLSFAFLALHIFKTDKIAYVFDSSNQLTASLASQATNHILGMEKTLLPLLEEFRNKNSFAEVSQSLFVTDPNVLGVGLYELKDGGSEEVAKLEKTQTLLNSTLMQFPEIRLALQKASSLKRQIFTPFDDERVVLIEPLETKELGRHFALLGVFFADELKNILKLQGGQKSLLLRRDGQVLFSKNSPTKLPIKQLIENPRLKSFLSSDLLQQSLLLEASSEQAWLVSLAKVGLGDLMVVSLTEKTKVLAALSTLARRAFYFLGVLISITFLLSMILTRSLTSRLNDLVEATQKISKGQFHLKLDTRMRDEVGSLSASIKRMSGAIVQLLEENSAKARMEAELETAKAVQDNLFPPIEEKFPQLHIMGHYEPASECSGDWWYYHQWGNQLVMCIGDATGHGAPAALVTSAARAAFATAGRQNLGAGQLLEWINHAIYEVTKGRIMMTMFVAVYDGATQRLTYSNASHEPTFVIRSHKFGKPLKKTDLEVLADVNGPRLGQESKATYQEATIALEKDDYLFFYTDGLSDVKNPEGQALGERNFIKILTEACSQSLEIRKRNQFIREALADFRKDTSLIDDITFFSCQVGPISLTQKTTEEN